MGMKLQAVASSMLLAVGYDEDTYRYLNVPKAVYLELMKAESKGAYLKTHVIDVYPHRRMRGI